mmetsp:Transcript_11885/g.21146  ORF Transcript_11885/g.21146 Transcript_11885/m.21146 type:complete len:119 (-) Transcript_11885:459-815(-)
MFSHLFLIFFPTYFLNFFVYAHCTKYIMHLMVLYPYYECPLHCSGGFCADDRHGLDMGFDWVQVLMQLLFLSGPLIVPYGIRSTRGANKSYALATPSLHQSIQSMVPWTPSMPGILSV